MIGVFDSGRGGQITVEKMRELSADADICFLADRENAPYGTKSRNEIIALSKKNIKRLRDAGCDRILIACCTASTVYPFLSEEERRVSVPIIDATAKAAVSESKTKKIGVIATRATALSGAFEKSIRSACPRAEVTVKDAQPLVELVESGVSDENVKKRDRLKIDKILEDVKAYDFDVLILGCTHFPALEKTVAESVGRKTVSSSLAAAREILVGYGGGGSGKTLFL